MQKFRIRLISKLVLDRDFEIEVESPEDVEDEAERLHTAFIDNLPNQIIDPNDFFDYDEMLFQIIPEDKDAKV